MAEMNHSPALGYTVTLTDSEYDAIKTKALERDALAAQLAELRKHLGTLTPGGSHTCITCAAHCVAIGDMEARIAALEAALRLIATYKWDGNLDTDTVLSDIAKHVLGIPTIYIGVAERLLGAIPAETTALKWPDGSQGTKDYATTWEQVKEDYAWLQAHPAISETAGETEPVKEWKPDCVCDSDPANFRHRSDCPLRYWYGERDSNQQLAKAEERISFLEGELRKGTDMLDRYAAALPNFAQETAVEPPTWEDLRGAAPDATGDLSSEAFVRQLRNEWDKETPVEQLSSTPRPCGAASASLPGIAGISTKTEPSVCPTCGGKSGKSELKDGRTVYFCACDPCEYHDHRRIDQPCTCRHPTDPNPLHPLNADFRQCLKGHGDYSTWFPWCPKCPEFAGMTQAKTASEQK